MFYHFFMDIKKFSSCFSLAKINVYPIVELRVGIYDYFYI
jgi:hypothetical protein